MSTLKNSISTFKQFLKTQNLENQKLLLMVSGGVDSMVLLHVARQVVKGENLAVFHLNHNVRAEAKSDANFVQNCCSKNDIKFYLETLNTDEEKPNSQESLWRKARQQLSFEAAQDFDAQRILTAHHATDLAETMIFRLTKGCGPGGLAPFDVSTKPFWQIPKTEIIEYAKFHKLEWREDPTNQNLDAERNLIRHKVLPTLRTITPNLEKVFTRESQTFAEIDDYLVTQAQAQLVSGTLALADFLALHPALQKECLRQTAQSVPSQSELDDCLKWLLNEPKGHSTKNLGNTALTIKAQNIYWH